MADEISIVALIDKTRFMWQLLLSKLRVILLGSILFGLLGMVLVILKPIEYVATATLMLQGGRQGSMSNALQLASSLGISSGPAFNEEKLIGLLNSRTIVEGALLNKVTIDGKEDLLANHQFDFMGMASGYEDHDSLKNFRFISTDPEQMDYWENKVMYHLHRAVTMGFMVTKKEKSGFVKVRVETVSEGFSKYLTDLVIVEVEDFYATRMNKKARGTVDLLMHEVDSVHFVLNETEEAYAKWKDKSNFMVKAQGSVEGVKYLTDLQLLRTLYAEAQKNLAIAKFTLQQETALVEVVDSPVFPLKKREWPFYYGLIIFGVMGFFLISGWFMVKQVITDLIRAEHSRKQVTGHEGT